MIISKANKSEKNEGCEDIEGHMHDSGNQRTYDDVCANCGKKLFGDIPQRCQCEEKVTQKRITKGNYHPTVKPLKLMEYLIILGSQEKDIVLDPFAGSGTTGLAAELTSRNFICIEKNPEYAKIAEARISKEQQQLKLF